MQGIYELKFDNGQCYIGLSSSLQTRIGTHLRMMQAGEHHNKYVQECYDIYGPPQFKILKLGRFSQAELETLESDFIAKYTREGVSLLNIAKNNMRPKVIVPHPIKEVDFSAKVRSLMILKNIYTVEEQVAQIEVGLIKAKDNLAQLYAIKETMCIPLTPEEEEALDNFQMLIK